jgi:hypothetical protein
MAMTRLDSAPLAVSALKLYLKWTKEEAIKPSTSRFAIDFANACFSTSTTMAEAGRKTMDMLIADELAVPDDFLPGLVCAAINEIEMPKVVGANTAADAVSAGGRSLLKKGKPTTGKSVTDG